MRLLKIIWIAVVVFTIVDANSQSRNITQLFLTAEERGDEMFLDFYYEKALELYKAAYEKDPDTHLEIKIAKTYRMLNDYNQAVEWYKKAINDGSKVQPDHYYNYGEVLTMTGRYNEALPHYEKYLELSAGDSRAERKINALKNRRYLFRDSILYDIEDLVINTPANDFGARYYDKGIIFLSAEGRDVIIDPDYLRDERLFDLYYAPASQHFHGTPRRLKSKLNSKFHEGSVAIFNGEEKMIFTRNNYVNGKKIISPDGKIKLQLFFAEMTDKGWSNITPFEHNDITYSLSHPALSPTNDTLFFASDMPGGEGGIDLYMSFRNNDRWSKPKNLGPGINTPGDEIYPYFSNGRLFFSSNGYGSVGGLDIYRSKIKDGKFTRVVNLGFPINSNKDDYAFIINNKELSGYFTSNRDGGRGQDDIYKFYMNGVLLNGIVTEVGEEAPVEEVVVSVTDSTGKEIMSTLSDNKGRFHFYLPYDREFTVSGSKNDFTLLEEINISTKNRPFDLDTSEVELWRHKLFAEGRIYSNELQVLMPGVMVTIHNLTDGTRDSVITESDGQYRFIVQPDKRYRIDANKRYHLSNGFEVNTEGMDEGVLLNDIVLEEEFVDKDIVYFDFNESSIRPQDTTILNRMVSVLKKYPETWIVVGAHADSRGSKEYNQELAEERAEATVRYLTAHGIARDRIQDHAFGEALLLNRCSDGVICPEDEHSENRRTELKIEEPGDVFENGSD